MSEEKQIEAVEAEVLPPQPNEHLVPYVPRGHYKLKPEQKRAAQMIVANDFLPKKKGVKRQTFIEIAEELGVHRDTLYGWRSLPDFQRYVNDMIDLSINDAQSLAVARLIELANGDQTGTPSIKAIELILQMNGKLKKQYEHQVTTQFTGNDLKHVSNDELDALIGEYSEYEEE
jgi:hypothetical protein